MDSETINLLNGIAEIYEKSSLTAKKEIEKRYQLLKTSYEENECKTIEDFFDMVDNSDLAKDLLTFQLVYFQHSFRSKKTGKFFGMEDFNVVLASDYDNLMKQNIQYHQVTGWRGSGKSTTAKHNVLRIMALKWRVNIGIIARNEKKSKAIVSTLLNSFVEERFYDGAYEQTMFAKRFSKLIRTDTFRGGDDPKFRFKTESVGNGFVLKNEVLIKPYSPSVGGRGEATYDDRLDYLYGDDLEELNEAGTEANNKVWAILSTFMAAETGDPDVKILVSLTGNRVNPEPESVFNRFIDASTKSEQYVVRSLPVYDFKTNKSLTIRKSDAEALEWVRGLPNPADGTDNPLHRKNTIFDTTALKYVSYETIAELPTWRALFVDPAFSNSNDSDNTGFCYLFVAKDGRIFIGSEEVKIPSVQFPDVVVNRMERFKINNCFIEVGSASSMPRETVQREVRQLGLNVTVFEDLKSGGKSKPDRIKDALPLYNTETMSIIEELKDPLLTQIISFDYESMKANKRARKGYDALDAFAYALVHVEQNYENFIFNHQSDEYFLQEEDETPSEHTGAFEL